LRQPVLVGRYTMGWTGAVRGVGATRRQRKCARAAHMGRGFVICHHRAVSAEEIVERAGDSPTHGFADGVDVVVKRGA
jgi:hypothetical protein